MRKNFAVRRAAVFAVVTVLAADAIGGSPGNASWRLPLDSLDRLQLVHVRADVAAYQGRRAVHLREAGSPGSAADFNGEEIAIVSDSDFQDGTIEVDVVGIAHAEVDPGARGFVGIALRVQPKDSAFECFYLRPTNGRADDQLRRNHSVQYVSSPDFPWERLRKETPGVYESYTDLEAGAWTKIRIVVSGNSARLYVNGAAQPCLIVNDLKRGSSRGAIALWIGSGTEAYFSDLRVH